MGIGRYVVSGLAVLLIAAAFVIATPGSEKYNLTISWEPSTGGSVNPTSSEYAKGEIVTLTASPAANYAFVEWTGDVENTAVNPTTVVMNANKQANAVFEYTFTPPNVQEFTTANGYSQDNIRFIVPIQTPSVINIVNAERDYTGYIRKLVTLGDFDIKMKLTITNLQENPAHGTGPGDGLQGGCLPFFAVTRNSASTTFIGMNVDLGTGIAEKGDGITLIAYAYTTNGTGENINKYVYSIYLRDCQRFAGFGSSEGLTYDGWNYHPLVTEDPYVPDPDINTFYLHVTRVTTSYGSVTCNIYSDEAMTNLLKSLYIAGTAVNPMIVSDYNYFFPVYGTGGGGAGALVANGVAMNYDVISWG